MINIATILKHNVIGKLLNHVMVFFINILIVRTLGASESGIYFNELYLLNFIVFIFSAGLDYASIALLSQEPSSLHALKKLLLSVVVCFSVILVSWVFFSSHAQSNYFRQPGIAIVLFSIGNLLLIFYQGILSALKKFNLQNAILGVSNIAFLLYLLTSSANGSGAFANITVIYAGLFFFQGLLMLIFSSRIPTEKKYVSIKWIHFIKSGMYIMVSSLIYFAFLRVDNFFVEKYESGKVLGNYIQCGKIGQYFLYFSSIISSTILPFISTEIVGASYNEWKKMMRPYIILICIAAVIIAFAGKYIFPFLLGSEFSQMHSIMIILLPGFVCLGILTLLNTVYIGKGNIGKIFAGDLAGLIMVVVFDAWLVPRYGAYAAATISSIAYCLVFLFLLSSFKKQFSLVAKNSSIIRL